MAIYYCSRNVCHHGPGLKAGETIKSELSFNKTSVSVAHVGDPGADPGIVALRYQEYFRSGL